MTDKLRQKDRLSVVREKLHRLPRLRLANLPTPLEFLPRLTESLGGPKIFIKRDDMTGLAFGGNKTRQLEYVLAATLEDKPEVLVTGANIQSNWSRQSAAAAAKLGIAIVLVLRNYDSREIQGNVLLDYWLGAQVNFVNEPDMTRMQKHIDDCVAELRSQGRKAVKLDSWHPATAAAYVGMMCELWEQCESMAIKPTRLWLAAAGPTQAGIVLGAQALEWNLPITGVAPLRWTNGPMQEITAKVANEAANYLALDVHVEPSQIDNRDQFIGKGYGIPTQAGLAAMKLAARTDAILLDPVYTSKAMSGLMDAIQSGELTKEDTVIFLHTGGLPAVFAYRDAIMEMSHSV